MIRYLSHVVETPETFLISVYIRRCRYVSMHYAVYDYDCGLLTYEPRQPKGSFVERHLGILHQQSFRLRRIAFIIPSLGVLMRNLERFSNQAHNYLKLVEHLVIDEELVV